MTIPLLVFLHLAGMSIWLGAMFTSSIWTSRARRTGDGSTIAFAYSTALNLYKRLVSVAAVVTVLSGGILMLVTNRPWFRPFPEHWLFQMQVIGLIALLLTLAVVVPNSSAVAALAEKTKQTGDESAEFTGRVKRQAVYGSLVGAALVYLVLLGALRF
jgi:uncharacterized membrane protein